MEKSTLRKDELKRNYRKAIELSLIVSLLSVIGLLHALPGLRPARMSGKLHKVKIEIEDIARTYQYRKPPPPRLPRVPVPIENEAMPVNATIMPVELEFVSLPPPPEMPDPYEEFTFVPHEVPPRLKGGLKAIHRKVEYPQHALENRIEGMVVVGVLVDQDGNPSKVMVLKESGLHVGFEEAAVAGLRASKWHPARQRDRAVKVWIAVPFKFRIQYRAARRF
ncbi:MAG: energy transducer TonB [bacterium]